MSHPSSRRSSSSTETSTHAARRHQAIADLRAVSTRMELESPEPGTPPPRIRLQWGSHIPRLAREAALLMETEPGLFSWVPYTGQYLIQKEQRVEELQAVKVAAEDLVAEINQTLQGAKQDLAHKTLRVVNGVRRILDHPMTEPETQEKLRGLAANVLDIVDERKASIKAARAETLSLKDDLVSEGQAHAAELEEALDRTATTLDILRGGVPAPSPAPAIPAPRRRGRRTTRR